jgi:hypothetical protein
LVQRGERDGARRETQAVDDVGSSFRVDGEVLRDRLFGEHGEDGDDTRLAGSDEECLAESTQRN